MINREELLNTRANFSWAWGMKFFIETPHGNFIWNDPDYGGDNTITPYNGTLKEFISNSSIPYVRDKGAHVINKYCGSDIILK